MAITIRSGSFSNAKFRFDEGGLPITKHPTLARLDFQNEIYTLGGNPVPFSTLLTPSAPITQPALVYDFTTNSLETVPIDQLILKAPTGSKGLCLFSGETVRDLGSNNTKTINLSGGSLAESAVAVWGHGASVTASGDVVSLSGGLTALPGRPILVMPTPASGATVAAVTMTPNQESVRWHLCRFAVVDGLPIASSTAWSKRLYKIPDTVFATLPLDFTMVFNIEWLDILGAVTAMPVLELVGNIGYVNFATQATGVFRWAINNGSNSYSGPLGVATKPFAPVTVAMSFSRGTDTIRMSCNGEHVLDWSGMPSAFTPMSLDFGRGTGVPDRSPRCLMPQMAILGGFPDIETSRKLSAGFWGSRYG